MAHGSSESLPDALVEHLRSWVGIWPPADPAAVAANPRNAAPGWDGRIRPATGVVDPAGRVALGVAPDAAAALTGLPADVEEIRRRLPALLGRPDHVVHQAVFRWTTSPADERDLPEAGQWVDADDPRLPDWLRPFGGQALVAFDEHGRYIAGVGIKRHDPKGHEIAVGTAEAARGRGLARRLVAQAARRILARGAVPTYLHDPANVASARAASAAGFPDRGWRALGLGEPPSPGGTSP